jgi:uncharacterized protein involved in exopolysaccharide biosynthesis
MSNFAASAESNAPVFLTIGDIVAAISKYWYVTLAFTLLFLGLGVVYAVFKTPVYRAQIVLAPAPATEAPAGGLARLASGLSGGFGNLLTGALASPSSNKDVALAILRSRQFLSAYIEERGLMTVLFARQWDPVAKKWITEGEARPPRLSDAVDAFRNSLLSVEEERKSGIVTVSVRWRDRERAAAWANELIVRLNRTMRERSVSEARLSIDYLNRELEKTSMVGVQQAIYQLIEAQLSQIATASAREEFAFKIIDPAVVPEEDQFVSPQRLLAIAGGFFAGLLLGFLAAIVLYVLAQNRRPAH